MKPLLEIIDTENEPNILKNMDWGGKRKGSGRKQLPYKTKTLSFRIREYWVEIIKETVKTKIAELKQSDNLNKYVENT